MRRFFLKFGTVLALLICAAGAAPAAHAESCTYDAANPTLTGGCTGGNICLPDGNGGGACGTPPETTNNNSAPAPASTNGDESIVKNFEGSKAFAPVTTFLMSIFAWLLGVAMVTLDAAVYYTVVKMGDYINGLSAVGVTWRILRDIGNITLIFGFLAVGIATILNVDWYGGKKTLPMLIIVAVLLNFSLFISEAIIDTGNLFATQFYSQINGGRTAGGNTSITNEPISNAIMNRLGLATLYGSALRKNDLLKENNIIFISIFGGLLFMIAAFVMFSLAFILIARFVALLFLIILAPIGFAGLAVPQLKGTAEQWWSELVKQTVTAPALLLLLYIALAIITDARFLVGTGNSDAVGFVVGNDGKLNLSGFASYSLSFFVAMGALLSVTIFAKKLGAFGASWATKTAGKLSFGATAWAGRATLGWTANKGAKYLRGTALGRVPLVGTGLVKGLDRVAKGSFDVRGTGALKGLPLGGVDAGAAQKGGYSAELKEKIKAREEYAKTLTGKDQTKEQKTAIALAEKARKDIEESEKNKKDLYEKASKERVVLQAEVNRLEEQKRNDKYWQTDPANVRALETAQRNLKNSDNAVADAEKSLKEATEDLARKRKAEADIKSDVLKATGSAKSAQIAYAENINWGPGSWFAKNEKAAENIIKNAGKTKEQKDVESLMATIKKAAEAAEAAKQK